MTSAWRRRTTMDPAQAGDSGVTVKATWAVEASHHHCALAISW
jgi:hypothetical protein